jgi:hypothetical protein
VRPFADADADGMDDNWETRFALDPTAADGGLDADQDGAANLAEYLAGTDPRSSTSCLRLLVVRDGADHFILQFASALGRIYQIQTSDNLPSGAWSADGQTLSGTGAVVERTISLPAQGPRCYRVRCLAPQ